MRQERLTKYAVLCIYCMYASYVRMASHMLRLTIAKFGKKATQNMPVCILSSQDTQTYESWRSYTAAAWAFEIP